MNMECATQCNIILPLQKETYSCNNTEDMVNEISQSQKDKYCVIALYKACNIVRGREVDNTMGVPEMEEEEPATQDGKFHKCALKTL